jgi:tight adherence protein C
MPLYVYLACLAVCGAVVLLYWAFSGPTAAGEVRANLETQGGPITDYRDADLSRSTRERLVTPMVAAIGRRTRRLTSSGLSDHLTRQLNLAGLNDRWSVERLLALKVGVLVAGGVLVFFLLAAAGITRASVAESILIMIAAYVIPDVWLTRTARERQNKIELELPDVIDQITVSVESGLGFDSAMARAARTGKGLFAEELVRVQQDVQVGLSRDAAFDRLLDRTDIPDLRHVVLAIRQSDRYGLPLADTLATQAAELRDRRRARAEERAMKIPVKIVFPLVFCILPALFVVVLGPAVLQIYDNF